MSQITSSGSTDASTLISDAMQDVSDAIQDVVTDLIAEVNAEIYSVTYSEEGQTNNDDDGDIDEDLNLGDGADENGLTYPADIDLKDALLILGSTQSDIAEDQLEFTSDQMENLTAERSELAEKNIKLTTQMREKAEAAEKWGEIGKIAGYVAIGLTLAAGLVNPVMMVAGIAMLGMTILNETGATEDIIKALSGGNDNTILGTVLLGVMILGMSVATGGVGGVVMFTTLAPGLLFSVENCENMGMDTETAMWVSMGVAIGTALLSGVGMAAWSKFGSAGRVGTQVSKAASTTTTGTAKTLGTSAKTTNTVVNSTETAAKTSGTAAKTSGSIVKNSNTAAKTGSTTGTQATTTATNTGKTATTTAQTSAETTETLNSASRKIAQMMEEQSDQIRASETFMQKLAQGRLERLIERGLGNAANLATKLGVNVGKDAVVAMNQYTMLTQVVLDTMTTAIKAVHADYNYDASVLKAEVEYVDVEQTFATERYNAWKSIQDNISTTYQDRVSKMTDAIHEVHYAVAGHLRAV